MTIFQSLILGIIEGITEFLPVSSTFHLLFANQILNIQITEFVKTFDVVIQTGAILAVVFLYAKELLKNKNYIKVLLVSFIPTAIAGFLLRDIVKDNFFENSTLMLTAFIGVGFLLIIYEKFNKKTLTKVLSELNYKDAIIIGACQAFALVPGVSRAGAVILVMLILRYKRVDATKYSFLLAVPTIMAAGVFDLLKTPPEALLSQNNWLMLFLVGFTTAFITAYFSLKIFIKFVATNSFTVFGVYRIVIGVILLLYFTVL